MDLYGCRYDYVFDSDLTSHNYWYNKHADRSIYGIESAGDRWMAKSYGMGGDYYGGISVSYRNNAGVGIATHTTSVIVYIDSIPGGASYTLRPILSVGHWSISQTPTTLGVYRYLWSYPWAEIPFVPGWYALNIGQDAYNDKASISINGTLLHEGATTNPYEFEPDYAECQIWDNHAIWSWGAVDYVTNKPIRISRSLPVADYCLAGGTLVESAPYYTRIDYAGGIDVTNGLSKASGVPVVMFEPYNSSNYVVIAIGDARAVSGGDCGTYSASAWSRRIGCTGRPGAIVDTDLYHLELLQCTAVSDNSWRPDYAGAIWIPKLARMR